MSTLQPLGDAPEVFDILPLGQVHSTKGDFVVDVESFEAMKQAMEGKGVDIVVDYEHQTPVSYTHLHGKRRRRRT